MLKETCSLKKKKKGWLVLTIIGGYCTLAVYLCTQRLFAQLDPVSDNAINVSSIF